MNFDNSKRILSTLAFGFIVMTGTYNAVVINSESSISGDKYSFIHRLDEIYGKIEYNREVASTRSWKKIAPRAAAMAHVSPKAEQYVDQRSQSAESSSDEVVEAPKAAVQDELSLSLTAVANPKKWPQGLTEGNFTGNLTTNAGVIESLDVSLPNDEGLSVSFSEMNGNVFEYEYQGEPYSGMMYQDAPNSYVVSLTNGPLEGTRLAFKSEPSYEDKLAMEDQQREQAENNDAAAGTYDPNEAQVAAVDPNQDLQLQQQAQDIYAQEQSYIEQQKQAQEQAALDQAQGITQNPEQAAM